MLKGIHHGVHGGHGEKHSLWLRRVAVFAVVQALSVAAIAAEPAPELYRKHCAECNGADRYGLMGPALLP